MTNALNALFLLTLMAVFGGLIANGTSLAVSLMLAGPVTVIAFLAISFVYFSIVVIFGKPKKTIRHNGHRAKIWHSDALIHPTNG